MLAVVILTLNEERHIARAIASIRDVCDEILVVDSGSTDATVEIARNLGARVLSHAWVNYATQFNWAIAQLGAHIDWILRLDADEVVSRELCDDIADRLALLPDGVAGVRIPRRMNFMGVPVRRGGVFPVRMIRLFRKGSGGVEARWMDEHIVVDGRVVDFEGGIVDDNLNSLTWWTDKHNGYASREAVDLLNLEYRFLPESAEQGAGGMRRKIKEHVYARLPAGARAGAYFLYRWILRLGMLDRREARAFHVLQGFWYRSLVDMKVHEVKAYMDRTGTAPDDAIREVLGIDLNGVWAEDQTSVRARTAAE